MSPPRPQTPAQTAGPYVHIGCAPRGAGLAAAPPDLGTEPWPPGTAGQPVAVGGRILDGAGDAVLDAMVEIWQPGGDGRFGGRSGHDGWARRMVDPATGFWRVDTVRPAAIGGQAPHLMIWIAARGVNAGLHTRLYFAGDDHGGDRVLRAAGARGATMIARSDGHLHRLDIRLQGDRETVFLNV